MKMVTTIEELGALPTRSIIAGPAWDDEVYQKSDNVIWHTPGSQISWHPVDLEPRGPFAVIREGEILDDEERPMVLPSKDRPSDTIRMVLRINAYPIGQVEVNSFDGTITLHYSREDVIQQVRTALHENDNTI